MGTNQSHHHHQHHRTRWDEGLDQKKTAAMLEHGPRRTSSQGKPSPPSQARAEEITHNSVTLSWQPPRHTYGSMVFAYTLEVSQPSDPKTWTIVTKSCQGNTYQVKNLTPSTEYVFRVRAENIHGLSKSSCPSEVMETKMFEVDQQLYTTPPHNKPRSAIQRRHSISLHLDGVVTSILNHTDIEVKATACKEVKVSELGEETGEGGLGGKEFRERGGVKSGSLRRDAALRSSLQVGRKRSLPILLPGTRTNSLYKLRDSQTFPVSTKEKPDEGSHSVRRWEQRWRDRLPADTVSCNSSSREDVRDRKSCSSKEDCSVDGDLKSADFPNEESTESPWERDGSVKQVSDRIMSAPLCDDLKLALYTRTVTDGVVTWSEDKKHIADVDMTETGTADFRTLRSLLNSEDVIMKSSRSLPDVALTSKKHSLDRKLTTIVDMEEEEETVRITTL